MRQVENKLISVNTLSSLYLIVLFAGYSFYTSVFSFTITDVSESRGLTLLYRIFEVLLMATLFLLTLKKKIYSVTNIKVLWLFWALILCRFSYDIFVVDQSLPIGWIIDTFSYMVPMTLFPMLVIQKVYNKMDFKKVLFWVYILFAIAIIMAFVNNPAMLKASEEQLNASNSSSVISTGHMGLSVLILTVYILRHYSVPIEAKCLMIPIVILSLYVLLRSGSRGPVLSAAVVLMVALLSVSKNILKSLVWMFLVIAFFYLISDYIIDWVSSISPVLVNRFESKMDKGGQLNDRIDLYIWAWNEFKNNPFFGNAFGIYSYYFSIVGVSYSHNAFLDTIMQSGIFGGFLFVYLYIKAIIAEIRLLVMKHPVAWIGLIMVQMMSKVMVSSAFYLTPIISIGMVVVFIADRELRKKSIYEKSSSRIGVVRNTNV